MKITVVGPGAIGCLFGGLLTKSGQDVWFLDKSPERAELLQENGIDFTGLSGDFNVKIKITANPQDIGISDLVIICVKSYDTEAATKIAKDIVGDDTLVVTLQNGLGNIEVLSEAFGQEKVLAGITNHGATLIKDGNVKHAGKGETVIGRWITSKKQSKLSNIPRRQIYDIATIFKSCGFETKVSENIRELIWSKLIINVGINALTAITGLNNGRLIEFQHTRHILKIAVLEATKIAKKKKINLLYSDPVKKVESVCQATYSNVSSMLQDVLKKRRTEIDYINGAICSEGENLEIPTPINEVLTNLVKTIESSYEVKL